MKKILIIVICMLLMSCQNDKPILIENYEESIDAEQEEIIYGDGLWYRGLIEGETPFELQYNIVNNRAIGQIKYDDKLESLSGYAYDDYISMQTGSGVEFILYPSEHNFYGVMIDDHQKKAIQGTKDNEAQRILHLSEEAMVLSGMYLSFEASDYEGAEINITPLYDHIIYVEMTAYNGSLKSQLNYLAIKKDKVWQGLIDEVELNLEWTEQHELHLLMNNYRFNCVPQTEFDFSYSDSYRLPVMTSYDLGIATSPREDLFLQLLLEEDYRFLLEYGQIVTIDETITHIGLEGLKDVIQLFKDTTLYYVFLEGQLYEDGLGRLYTNDLDRLPIKMRQWSNNGITIRKAMTETGFTVPLSAITLQEFVQDDYVLRTQVVGRINKDTIEDSVMLLSGPDENVLLLLKGTSEGYDLELITNSVVPFEENATFEGLKIEDHMIYVSFYGGDDVRWSKRYGFTGTSEHALVSVEMSEHLKNDFDVKKTSYNLLTNVVVVTREIEGELIETIYSKRINETITLNTFNFEEGIDTRYE